MEYIIICKYQRRIQVVGGAPGACPPKIGKKYDFFGVKSWFFTRNTPKHFAPPSARRKFFKSAPPNLKSRIRPWYGSKLKTFKKRNIKWDYGRVVYSLNFVITGSVVDTNGVRLICVVVVFGNRPMLHLNWEYILMFELQLYQIKSKLIHWIELKSGSLIPWRY